MASQIAKPPFDYRFFRHCGDNCLHNHFFKTEERVKGEKTSMKINVFPKICNICGGKVEYIANYKIFGHYLKYGKKSGYCYHCKKCGATVGTHIDRPLEAYGLLANDEMRKLRQRNHDMFDKFWKNKQQRTKFYNKLAKEMGIPFEECHFAYFSVEELERSYQIMLRWWREKYDK